MFDLDDVAEEMKDNAVAGHVLSGNEPHSSRGALGRCRVGKWSFCRNLHENRMGQRYGGREGGGGTGTIDRLSHHAGCPHDLILIPRVTLLQAGGEDLPAGDVRNGDASPAHVLPQHHRSMRHDSNENGRGLWLVQMWGWW